MFGEVTRLETQRFTLDDPIAPLHKMCVKKQIIVIQDIDQLMGGAIAYWALTQFLMMNTPFSSNSTLAERKVEELTKAGRIATLTTSANEQGLEATTLNVSPLIAEKVSQGPYKLFNAADPNKPHILAHGRVMSPEEWENVQAEAMQVAKEIDAQHSSQLSPQFSKTKSEANQIPPGKSTTTSHQKTVEAQAVMEPKQKVNKPEKGDSPHSHEEIAKGERAYQKKLHEKERLEAYLARLHRFERKDQERYALMHEPVRTSQVN